ncbi:hypothetical protein NPIL_362181 [Nephila pilipes]|uniref:Uncharacterized protein n=1 Tax=Nephila pilipes TaxID=299642 RepID=A0A8X6MY01_NEPPI|nr:hypothetical protein NPIL_362181 [Nephila pilipes]
MAWIYRFLYNTKNVEKNLLPIISVDEFENAGKILHKLIQKESFVGIEDPNIHSLRPIKYSYGILKVQTKIVQHEDSENFLHPVILPSDNPVVQRLIYELNLENQQAGSEDYPHPGGDLLYKQAFQRQPASPATKPERPTQDASSASSVVTRTGRMIKPPQRLDL